MHSARRLSLGRVLVVLAVAGGIGVGWSQSPPAARAAGYSVLFDNAHAETAGNADWVISTSQPDPLAQNPNPTSETSWTGGISAWGVALQRSGRYSLKTNTSALTYGTSSALDLSHFNALVLPEPNTLFTSAEKTAILTFVRNGGGLFMVADHNASDRNNDGYDSLHIFNDLMNNGGVGSDPFGIQFDVVNISSENPNNDTPNADPLLQGPFGTAQGTIIRSGTTETINPAHNANARGVIYRVSASNTGTTGIEVARSLYGSGRVVAMGDSSAIDDGTCASGNNCFNGWNDPAAQDSILFPNATEWLASGSGAPAPTATPTPPGPTNTPTRTPT
ncbi:MAG: hydrolase, partial [Chloroflexota bacterium]|nr:hydrolase [Chloroflexota bacterium]